MEVQYDSNPVNNPADRRRSPFLGSAFQNRWRAANSNGRDRNYDIVPRTPRSSEYRLHHSVQRNSIIERRRLVCFIPITGSLTAPPTHRIPRTTPIRAMETWTVRSPHKCLCDSIYCFHKRDYAVPSLSACNGLEHELCVVGLGQCYDLQPELLVLERSEEVRRACHGNFWLRSQSQDVRDGRLRCVSEARQWC